MKVAERTRHYQLIFANMRREFSNRRPRHPRRCPNLQRGQNSNKAPQQSNRRHRRRGVRCVRGRRGRAGSGRRRVGAFTDHLVGHGDAGSGADVFGVLDGGVLIYLITGAGKTACDAVEESGVGADALNVELAAAGDGTACDVLVHTALLITTASSQPTSESDIGVRGIGGHGEG